MVLPASEQTRLEGQFDHFCKIVVANGARDYRKSNAKKVRNEKCFCELNQQEFNQLRYEDCYEVFYKEIVVKDFYIDIHHELIFEALSALPKRKREVIIMSYWLNLTDEEISNELNLVRRTVNYLRGSSLKALKNYLEDKILDINF